MRRQRALTVQPKAGPITRLKAYLTEAVIRAALMRKQPGLGRWITLVSNMSDFTALGSVLDQLGSYKNHVYKCVNVIKNRIQTVPFYLEYERGNEVARVEQHPFYELIRRPNPIWTWRNLIEFVQIQIDLCGRAFWRLKLNAAGRPVEIWPMVPSNFKRILPAEDGSIIGYYEFFVHQQDGTAEKKLYPAEKIVDFRYPHPTLLLEGASPIQAAAYAYDTDLAIRVYQRSFFHNNARPDILLSSEQQITEADADRIRALWKKKFQGAGKDHFEPAVLGKGMKVETLTVNNEDLAFAALAGWTKEDIFETYGVPEGILGTVKDVNKANQFGVERTFNQVSIRPRCTTLAEAITFGIVQKYDPALRFVFENPVPQDKEFRLKETESKLKSGYSTINEERELDGREPVPWGNVPILQLNMAPLGSLDESQSSTPKAAADVVAASAAVPTSKDERRRNFQALHARRILARAKPVEDWLRRFFRRQEKEVLARFDDQFKIIDGATRGMSLEKMHTWIEQRSAYDSINIDIEVEDVALLEGITPYITLAVEATGQEALEFVGAIDIPFDVQNDLVRREIGVHLAKIKEAVNPGTYDAIKGALTAGFDAGESMQDIAARIRDVFTEAKQVRSLRIARTEIGAASSLGQFEGYRQSGVVERKEWVAGMGARETHAAAAARYGRGGDPGPIPLDEDFQVGEGRTLYPGGTGIAAEDIN